MRKEYEKDADSDFNVSEIVNKLNRIRLKTLHMTRLSPSETKFLKNLAQENGYVLESISVLENNTISAIADEIEELDATVVVTDAEAFRDFLEKTFIKNNVDDPDYSIADAVSKMKISKAHKLLRDLTTKFKFS